MIIKEDKDLWNFQFWGGAVANASQCTRGQLQDIQDVLEDIYPDGIEDYQLNDLFWFDFDELATYTSGIEID